MSKITRQQQADLATDAYNTRTVTKGNKKITIEGNDYKVLAVRNNPVTDYQGTVYQDVRTNEIVVAHRGTATSDIPSAAHMSKSKPTVLGTKAQPSTATVRSECTAFLKAAAR